MRDCIQSIIPIQRVEPKNTGIVNQIGCLCNPFLLNLKNKMNNFYSPNPYQRLFVWNGVYVNDEIVSEINYTTKCDTNFGAIDKNKLLYFGLNGSGYYFYYNVYDGNFVLNDKQIQVLYKVKDNIYWLTNAPNEIYNDVITYKNAESKFSPFSDGIKGENLKTEIYEYCYGYKHTLSYDDGISIKFQPVVHLPVNNVAYIQIQLTNLCNVSLDGEIVIVKNGKIVVQEKAPLDIGNSGKIDWIIK